MIRRYGTPPVPNQRYQHRPGAYAILTRGSSLLLTFQVEPIPEFQLPGGGIDRGESPTQALHREAFEETGWRISRPRRISTFRRFVFMPDYDIMAEKVCHMFLARPTIRIGEPLEPGHHAAWIPISNAGDLLANPGDRALVRRLFS